LGTLCVDLTDVNGYRPNSNQHHHHETDHHPRRTSFGIGRLCASD